MGYGLRNTALPPKGRTAGQHVLAALVDAVRASGSASVRAVFLETAEIQLSRRIPAPRALAGEVKLRRVVPGHSASHTVPNHPGTAECASLPADPAG